MDKARLSILRITDGTTTVDLLRGNTGRTGIFLKSWRTGRVRYKGGGNWQDSPMAHGRRLISHVLDNVIETFELGALHSSQNRAAELFQPLDMLLDKAAAYSEDEWSGEPVWLEMRLGGSLHSQYALIHAGQSDDYGEPFAELFTESHILDDVVYAIERGQWLESPPGVGTAILGLDGTTTIIEYTTDNEGAEVFVTNKYAKPNVTNLYSYDASETTFSSDLMGSAQVIAFPDPPAVDDALYFISRNTVGFSGPFSSIVFNVGTVAADITVVYEYWNGAAWTALTVEDNTAGFTVSGKGGVYWVQPGNWALTTVNALEGWIVRCRVSAIGASPSAPVLDEVPWYNISPFVTVPASAVGGTLPAITKLDMYMRSSEDLANGGIDRIIVGARSLERGASFTPYLAMSDNHTSALYTSIAVQHPEVSFPVETAWPTRKALQIEPQESGGSPVWWTWQTDVIATLTPATLADFAGKYRIFVRALVNTSPYHPYFRILFNIGGASGIGVYSKEIRSGLISALCLFEAGTIAIPDVGPVGSMTITVQTYWPETLATTPHLRIMDIILMPVDEWSLDAQTASGQGALVFGHRVTVDGITKPKDDLDARVYDSSGNFTGRMTLSASEALNLQPNREQTLWFLTARRHISMAGDSFWYSQPYQGMSVKLSSTNRYHGMRADK